jgi:hypothetical protein
MNRLLSVLCLSALFAAGPALAHEMHGQPMHGGVVAEAGQAQFEVVARDGVLTVHASKHGEALATAGATGKLTVLSGSAKREIDLKPAGNDLLQGKGSLAAGDKLLLNVVWPGQNPLTARAVVK